MRRLRSVSLTDRLERVKAIAGDLSRELARRQSNSPTARAMADQILADASAVVRALKRAKT